MGAADVSGLPEKRSAGGAVEPGSRGGGDQGVRRLPSGVPFVGAGETDPDPPVTSIPVTGDVEAAEGRAAGASVEPCSVEPCPVEPCPVESCPNVATAPAWGVTVPEATAGERDGGAPPAAAIGATMFCDQ